VIHTSGTTGGGLRITTTVDAVREQWAVWWRYRAWHGLHLGVPCAYFGGRSVVPPAQQRPPFWRHSRPLRQVMFSGFHMQPGNLPAYVDELCRVRPPWIHGYPSLLSLLATYILDERIDLGYKVDWVTVGAENLLAQQADLIARAFGVRVRQHYGMAEGAANFSECENGRLHVDEDFAAVEFVPSGDGISCRIIGTNLSNLTTPLLRYDVQDSVTLFPGGCDCGRPGRVVETVDGRKEDYVLLKNGAKLGRLDHIFKGHIHIREAQIYQNVPGELVLRIVRGNLYSQADESRLLTDTRQRVGSEANIRIEYLERISRPVNGKLRFVLSDVAEGKLERTEAH
jgi:phenylacetate-CoA ligase